MRLFEEECVLAGLGRGGLVEALMNREWGFGELGEDRRWGGDISRVSGPWRGGGFMMDLVREVGGSVMVVGSIPPPPLSLSDTFLCQHFPLTNFPSPPKTMSAAGTR